MSEDVLVWLTRHMKEAAKTEFEEKPRAIIVTNATLDGGNGSEPIHKATAWVKLTNRTHTITLNLKEDGSYSNFQISSK